MGFRAPGVGFRIWGSEFVTLGFIGLGFRI
jgi:hypothetical protein